MRDARKEYGHVRALQGASLTLHRGEILALVGDNGAGKSTLLKSLCGAVRLDSGLIEIDGQPVDLSSIETAKDLGIEAVYQDLSLAPDLTVADNVFLGREIVYQGIRGRLGMLDRPTMATESNEALQALGINLKSVSISVERLSGGQRQAVAIARAVRWATVAILLDEPTAALGTRQTRIVLDTIRNAAARGLGVLIISHDMPRMLELADRIIVLRHGRDVAQYRAGETSINQIVGAMLGETVQA
ncbi:MAG: ATP-binding cassette domain-containing protein [Actinomycetales bacterium]|nr:ATP-binding cassette domain-containing protein [Actinomycetales bacterium]